VVLCTGLIVPVVRKPELDDDSNSDDDDAECAVEIEERKPPSILPDIPPLSTLLSKEPSPLLAFNLLDVLYATPSIHTMRHPRHHSRWPLQVRLRVRHAILQRRA
jgi:hypothetical protein